MSKPVPFDSMRFSRGGGVVARQMLKHDARGVSHVTCRPVLGIESVGLALSQLDPSLTSYDGHGLFLYPDTFAQLKAIQNLQIYSMQGPWTQEDVDRVLMAASEAVRADANHFSHTAPILGIGGGNGAPSGTYQAPTGAGGKATTGMEAIYALNHVTAHPWTITYNGGVAIQKLLGNDDREYGTHWETVNYLQARVFTAVPGTLAEIRLKGAISGNVQVAIYSDNAGSPGTVLACRMAVPVVVGWNTIALNTTVNLSAANYWLAWVSDRDGIMYHDRLPGTGYRYTPLAYGSAFPDNPHMATNGSQPAIAGWGIT